MASIADIRHHMRVVSQTLQITKAMQMISTSKMKKGLARYDANAIYLKEVRQTIKDVLMHAEGQSHRSPAGAGGKPLPRTSSSRRTRAWPAATTAT